jgi:hypothetical protein
MRIGMPEGPDRRRDVAGLPRQIKMGKEEVRACALEYNHAKAPARVHADEQVLQVLE